VLFSDLSRRANIAYKLKQFGFDDRLDDQVCRNLLDRIKQMEQAGYDLEAAEGTFELLTREALHPDLHFFDVDSYQVTTGKSVENTWYTNATVTLRINEERRSATAVGHGPLDALQRCIRMCLAQRYPEIREVHLTDYKARLLEERKGASGRVRVLTEWTDRTHQWSTIGISHNVVEASWQALLDAIRLELLRAAETKVPTRPVVKATAKS
jgi:2-isopropylmalate synthase